MRFLLDESSLRPLRKRPECPVLTKRKDLGEVDLGTSCGA